MRRPLLAVSQIFISGVLLLPAAGVLRGQTEVVGADGPTAYTSNQGKVESLNASGTHSRFTDYETNFNKLEKSVATVSGSGAASKSVDVIPVGSSRAPTSGSATATVNVPAVSSATVIGTNQITANWSANGNPFGTYYIAQISADPGFTSIINSSETPFLSATFTGLSPSTVYYMRVKAVRSDGSGSAFISLPSAMTLNSQGPSDYVSGSLGAGGSIKITDQGYGLTAADKNAINVLLAQVPQADLAGIKQIVFTNQGIPGVPTITNGVMTVSGNEGDTGYWTSLTSELSQGVGLNTYNNYLSSTQKTDWKKVSGISSDAAASTTFAQDYAVYIKDSANWLKDTNNAQQLQVALYVAAVMKNYFYASNSSNGGTVTMTYAAASRKSAGAGETFYDQVLTFGSFNYGIKNGQLVNWWNFGPPPALQFNANGQPVATFQSALIHTFAQPVNIPATVLSLIPLS